MARRTQFSPIMLGLLSLVIALPISECWSSETDWYTPRYQGKSDALPAINEEMQNRVNAIVDEMNHPSDFPGFRLIHTNTECDWNELNSKLGDRFRRPVYGQMEAFVAESPKVPKIKVTVDQSIYRVLPTIDYLPIKLGTYVNIGFAAHFTHDGLVIGSDKLGHFLDEGYYYYFLVHQLGRKIQEALKFGDFTENAYNGRWSSGIISYADLAANYEGYHFWLHSLGTPENRSLSKYFQCKDGVGDIKEKIDIRNYLNAAWDEGMNCNAFRSRSMGEAFTNLASTLEHETGKRYHCPVYPTLVPSMIQRYGENAKYIIHPTLLNGYKRNSTNVSW